MNDLSKIIGRQIKKARERKGLRQVDLARRAGINDHLLWSYEKGEKSNPQLSNLIKIADACSVSVDYLVGR